ncbi:MAG: glutamine synthetase family protein [Eubacteriales bacterium]
MNHTIQDILQFVQENDVEFVRLAFCDLYGEQKNIAIMATELERAFHHGISFDASAIDGFLNVGESDLLLFPDPSTIAILPWRPQQSRVARFFCDIRRPDGTPFEGDGRTILRQAAQEAQEMGYQCKLGAECEFYLFHTDEDGEPTRKPLDRGGYFSVAPLDRGENVRREICLTLKHMGIQPESSHHEQGPGQNEVVIRFQDAVTAADDLMTLKSVICAMAEQNGLWADFGPKPLPGRSGSGLHFNLSLFQDGRNIFRVEQDQHCRQAESFIAGILRRVAEITVFLNPLPQSYLRLGEFEAPRYISWSHQNRSQLIRIPFGREERARMELRSPDPSCNPYFAMALLLRAGMEGIRDELPLCPPVNRDLLHDADAAQGLESLPTSLSQAVELAKHSEFLRRCLPQLALNTYLNSRQTLDR